MDRVVLERFRPLLPEPVSAAIADAHAGTGPLVDWLEANEAWVRAQCEALFRATPPIDAEVLGWVAGLTSFVTDFVATAAHGRAPLAAMVSFHAPASAGPTLAAFVAGLAADVPTRPRAWPTMEAVAALLDPLPAELVAALPRGLGSDLAIARATSLRLARRAGAAAVEPLDRARASAEGVVRRRLDAAHAELHEVVEVNGDDRLARLLAAWRATFDPALVPAIVEAGVSHRRAALRAPSKAELEDTWHLVAARHDPADVERLLATAWPSAWKLALRRIDVLSRFPPDPRIARALPRIWATYTSHGAHPFRRAAATLAAAFERAQTGPAPVDLIARPTRSAVDVDAAWAAFRAEPGSTERRLVLADALQATGDPRGEYLVLACHPEPDGAMRRRAAALLETHGDAWVGPLPVRRVGRRFERGFLVAGAMAVRGRQLRAIDPADACTLEELHLDVGYISDEDVEGLVAFLGAARSLRTLVTGSSRLLDALAGHGPFPGICCFGQNLPLAGPPAAFPNLAMVATAEATPAEALDRAARAKARALVLFGAPLAEALRAFGESTLEEARFVLQGGRGFELVHRGPCVVLRRDGPARIAWGSGRYEPDSLSPLVSALGGAGWTDVAIMLPAVGAKVARAELARVQGAKVHDDGSPFDLFRG